MTFYFFDLETSGFSPRNDRIMQFAGQRTDLKLNPIGSPDNILLKLTADVLPQPGAVLVHGISPQKTLAEGLSEADFCQYFVNRIAIPDTTFVGYNNIRFDNDFIRFTLWRNFHDAYEWSWKDGCSTWDLLDVTRMTRALRPDGIDWPFAPDGRPTNSLEYISSVNHLDHEGPHDAMGDVNALLAVARMLKTKQSKLFGYLLNIRQKIKVAPLVTKGDPIIYTSGRYPADFEKTTVVAIVAERPDKSGALVYDLRIDPDEFKNLPAGELAKRWKDRSDDAPYFPIKELKYNRAPAIAPISVLDAASAERLKIHVPIIDNHLQKLRQAKNFGDKLIEALDIMWPNRQPELVIDPQKVDSQLYDGFIKDDDKAKMSVVRAAEASELSELNLNFGDERLKALLPLYKARNFPAVLSPEEQKFWLDFRRQKLTGGPVNLVDRFFSQIEELTRTPGLDTQKRSLLEDLRAYAKSVIPAV